MLSKTLILASVIAVSSLTACQKKDDAPAPPPMSSAPSSTAPAPVAPGGAMAPPAAPGSTVPAPGGAK